MNRITVTDSDGSYSVSDDDFDIAIHRLGLFEDAIVDLLTSAEKIPSELEAMRFQGKEKTVRYKETIARKLIFNNIMAFFERHGLIKEFEQDDNE